ncbi:MAG: AMP-binding protein [Nocardioides sp.]|uniref:AMP-binding protein n=1 Tax=Nocardioides sp. TaxID=35761 RepID=UPI0039E6CCA0
MSPRRPGDAGGNAVVFAGSGRRTTWAELSPAGRDLVPDGGPTAYGVVGNAEALPIVLGHARAGAETLLTTAGRLDETMRAELTADGFAVMAGGVRTEPTATRPGEPGRLWLLTSGSTGRPKRIGHTLASLTTVTAGRPPQTWLCPYLPGSYAWWQLVTLGLGVPGQDLVMLDPGRDEWTPAATAYGVTAVSGTPTFWRRALIGEGPALARLGLRQITLGGEPVDQAVLDELRAVFPAARISWIYASSEVGASIVVHDGRAGFPAGWLDRETPGRPRLRIVGGPEGGELLISSPHHGAGLAGEVATGDAVRREGDRILITGRLDRDEINVGGAKASAGRVREVLLSHPDVAWATVRGRRAPLVGSVVVAEVVDRSGGLDVADLTRWAAGRLPDYAVPRRISVLPAIPVKESLKSDV